MVELNYKRFVIFWICETLSTTFIISGTMKTQILTAHSIQTYHQTNSLTCHDHYELITPADENGRGSGYNGAGAAPGSGRTLSMGLTLSLTRPR